MKKRKILIFLKKKKKRSEHHRASVRGEDEAEKYASEKKNMVTV